MSISSLSPTRVFLDWDGPCLVRASRWLIDRFGADMQQVLVVLPVGRAGRRLTELLADQAGEQGIPLAPPRIMTVGQLPEQLMGADDHDGGHGCEYKTASDLSVLLAWVSALQQVDESQITAITTHMPDRDRLLPWLGLAQDLMRLHSELAGHLIEPSDVGAMLDSKLVEFPDSPRWDAIASVYRAYQQVLQNQQQIDHHAARQMALEQGDVIAPGSIVLIGVAEMPLVTRRLLDQVADHVVALVHAPDGESSAFDEYGCVIESAWATRYFDIAHEQRMVDRPTDQATAVLDALRQGRPDELVAVKQRTPGLRSRYRTDQITVGLGDQTMARPLARTLELAGLPARVATGSPWLESRPARLLAALARYMPDRRFDDLSVLLRHSDLQAYLDRQDTLLAESPYENNYLTLLDRYVSETLTRRVTGDWLLDCEKNARLIRVVGHVESWLGVDAVETRSLPDWSHVIAQLVGVVYDDRPLRRFVDDESALIESLGVLAQVLREQAALDSDLASTPVVTLADAIGLTITRASTGILPEPGGTAAIELLGWLELHLDDAPLLVVTGFNEGLIPGVNSGDSFLPDSARGVLGLSDHRQRYARDLMMITAIAHSRERLVLIAGRRDHDDNPLTPSRLMLAVPAEQLPDRVLAFYQDRSEIGGDSQGTSLDAGQLLRAGGRSGFGIPQPHATEAQIEKLLSGLSVTAFADYLRCPYRFYLKHVLNLKPIDDGLVELDARLFGTIAHQVLEIFAKSSAACLTDADAVAAAFDAHLQQVMGQKFGPTPRASVRVQGVLLQQRLHALAKWQAQQVRDGWSIVTERVEGTASAELLDDQGRPAVIRGRIDRIDQHEDGRVRLIDYKTGDQPAEPEKYHRVRGEWVDLQLPLYVVLAKTMGFGCDVVELGFVRLPKSLDDANFKLAKWDVDDLSQAADLAGEVIGKIRDGVFWPPVSPPPVFSEDFSWICQDGCFEPDAGVRR